MISRVRESGVARLAIALQERYGRDAGGNMAAAIAYYGFLSLFPLLLLGLSVLGFFLAGNPAAEREWTTRLSASVPGLETLIGRNVAALVKRREEAGIVGLVTVLWTGSGVVAAAERVLGRIFGVREKLGFVKEKARLLGTMLGLGALAILGTAVATAAASVRAAGAGGVGLAVAGVLVGAVIDFGLFITTYRVLIRKPGPPWRQLAPGALFAAAGWTGLKFGGAWYASRTVGNANAVYGTFATTVGVLLILYLAARLFVYGAELIAVLREERGVGEGSRGGDPMAAERDDGAPGEGSTAGLVGKVATDVGTLVKKEVELARQEIMEAVSARLKAAIALGIVAALALFAVGFLAATAAAALDLVVAPWISRLIVAGVFLVMAAAAAVFAVARLKRPPLAPVETKRTLKEDVEWAKAQLRR